MIKILSQIPHNNINEVYMRNLKKLLGNKIREYRKSKKLTQEQLAELVGIGTANISYIETGKFAPSMETMERLCQVLNVYPYELYMFEHLRPIEEIKTELFEELEKDEDLLRLVYKFYRTIV